MTQGPHPLVDEKLSEQKVLNYFKRLFNLSNESLVTESIDGPETKHVPSTVAVTNGADGTYTYYIPGTLNNKTALNLQMILSGGSGTVTVTVEATWENNGTAAASCDYTDVTIAMTNLTAADAYSYTASTAISSLEKMIPTYWKVKVVAATSGADDADWTVHSEQYYR